jgi:HEAT repeat protein
MAIKHGLILCVFLSVTALAEHDSPPSTEPPRHKGPPGATTFRAFRNVKDLRLEKSDLKTWAKDPTTIELEKLAKIFHNPAPYYCDPEKGLGNLRSEASPLFSKLSTAQKKLYSVHCEATEKSLEKTFLTGSLEEIDKIAHDCRGTDLAREAHAAMTKIYLDRAWAPLAVLYADATLEQRGDDAWPIDIYYATIAHAMAGDEAKVKALFARLKPHIPKLKPAGKAVTEKQVLDEIEYWLKSAGRKRTQSVGQELVADINGLDEIKKKRAQQALKLHSPEKMLEYFFPAPRDSKSETGQRFALCLLVGENEGAESLPYEKASAVLPHLAPYARDVAPLFVHFPENGIRLIGVKALGTQGERGLPQLLKFMQRFEEGGKGGGVALGPAMNSIAKLSAGKKDLTWLKKYLRDADVQKRNLAIEALATLGEEGIQAIAEVMNDPEQIKKYRDFRGEAIGKIAALGKAALPVLRPFLNEKNLLGDKAANVFDKMNREDLIAEKDLLLKSSAHPSRYVRISTALALSRMGDEAMPIIQEILKRETDHRVLELALEALLKCTPKEIEKVADSLQPLLQAMGSFATPSRALAFQAGGRLGERFMPEILRALKDGPINLRFDAVKALEQDPEKNFTHLQKAASDGESLIAQRAVRALSKAGPKAIPVLKQAIQSDFDSVRRAALESIIEMDNESEELTELISEMVANEQEFFPSSLLAINYLQNKGKGIPAFQKGVFSKSVDVAQESVKALVALNASSVLLESFSKLPPESPVKKLIMQSAPDLKDNEDLVNLARKDPDPSIRILGLRALGLRSGNLVSEEPIENELEQLFKKEPMPIRIEAARSLLPVLGERGAPFVKEALTYSDEVQVVAAESLAQMGEPGMKILSELFENPKGIWTPQGMVQALITLGPKAAPLQNAIKKGFDKHSAQTRERLAKSLWKMGESALPLVDFALAHNDAIVRRGAVESAKEIGEKAIPLLFRALADKELGVVLDAETALGKVMFPN